MTLTISRQYLYNAALTLDAQGPFYYEITGNYARNLVLFYSSLL